MTNSLRDFLDGFLEAGDFQVRFRIIRRFYARGLSRSSRGLWRNIRIPWGPCSAAMNRKRRDRT